MKHPVLNVTGEEVGQVELPASIFQANINRDLMHQALVRQLANARRGTHSAKSRSEVNRTTAKWYRQKGTGRARHGSKRAPIFVGGGVAHGPKNRSYEKQMPRKMRRAALCSALSVKAKNDDIIIIDELKMDTPRTREMGTIIGQLSMNSSALVLVAERDELVEKSVKNLAEAKALRANYLNIRDLLGYQKILLPLSALEMIQGFLGEPGNTLVVTKLAGSKPSAEEEE